MQCKRTRLVFLLLFLICLSFAFGQAGHPAAPSKSSSGQLGVSVTPLRMAGETKVESDLGYGISLPSFGDGGFYTQIAYTGSASQEIYWISLSGEKKLALDLSRLSVESGI